jgi:UDP-glucuronate 4-epimerase
MEKTNVLVTGCAGFIGYHLVEALLKTNKYNITGIDNLNSYYDVNLKLARLKKLGLNKKQESYNDNKLYISDKTPLFHFGKIDITDLDVLECLFKEKCFDNIIHLAAQAGVRYSIENPSAYIQSNIVGFFNILECSKKTKIKHLIYASSSSVYGGNEKIPFSEEDKVDTPKSLYAATKKSNELMAYTYSHLFNMRTTALRFFTVYGPWGRPDMAPMLFANAICNDKPIKVFNEGKMLRDFTYIDDIVDGIIKCIDYKSNRIPQAEVFNIGNSKPVNLMDFIYILEKEIGKKADKIMMPMQQGDVKTTFADTTNLQNKVKYKSKTELKEGVASFFRWFSGYYIEKKEI